MNSISLAKAAVWTSSDGIPHATRALALAHETYLVRLKNLDDLGLICSDELAISEIIALRGDEILRALNVRETRKKKVAE